MQYKVECYQFINKYEIYSPTVKFFDLTIISNAQHLQPGEGFVNVEGGRIWYKIVGTGKGTPLLVIHGGPGGRSCGGIAGYSGLGDERPVIFYDQLGSGLSDRPTDTTLWQLPRFVDEVEKLRRALHLKKINILSSSWVYQNLKLS